MTGGPAAAIVGVYEHPDRVAPDTSEIRLKATCAVRALEDAGLTLADVDALYDVPETGELSLMSTAEYFGITPRVLDGTNLAGASYEAHAIHAARDIAAGRARVALLTYGSRARSSMRAVGTGVPKVVYPAVVNNTELPWGLPVVGNYAMAAMRHLHEYGTTPEQLAEIAVVTRYHATRNPQAVAGLAALGVRDTGELTVEDVVSSRVIADPLHALDCCLVSDGAGAVVIASAEVAAGTAQPPVWVLGGGEATGAVATGSDVTTTAAARSAADAFARAGVSPQEVDVAMLYDSFTFTVLAALEDLGFCAKGEGGPYVSDGRLRFDRSGGPALNTDGGGLSSTHPGMRGIFLLIEATRQLRGRSTAQVPGARLAVAHGNGGTLGTRHGCATVVLGADR
ncbi:thiolase C-terminal domain-containing protein [Blastococcus sp. SYSU D00669]